MGTRPTPAIDKNGIAWLAGEASGDYIASLVLPEVEKRFPGTPQYGVGGPRMRAENFHAWHDIRELSVRLCGSAHALAAARTASGRTRAQHFRVKSPRFCGR